MGGDQGLGQSSGFTAADQKVTGLEGDVPVGGFSLGGEKPSAFGGRRGEEIVEGVPKLNLDVFPVVEPSAADLFVIEREAERFDEMEGRARREAETASCAGVVGNFGGDENEVEHGRRIFGRVEFYVLDRLSATSPSRQLPMKSHPNSRASWIASAA
jgi:hypothetical protein